MFAASYCMMTGVEMNWKTDRMGMARLNSWTPFETGLWPEDGKVVIGCGPNRKDASQLDVDFVTVRRLGDGGFDIQWSGGIGPERLLYWREIPPLSDKRSERIENCGLRIGLRIPVVVPTATATEEEQARISALFKRARWVFAKTMPKNPHEYTLRREWHDADFVWAVNLMRRAGYCEGFWSLTYIQCNVNGYKHWTMGRAINYPDGSPWTILINRKSLIEKPKPQRIVN